MMMSTFSMPVTLGIMPRYLEAKAFSSDVLSWQVARVRWSQYQAASNLDQTELSRFLEHENMAFDNSLMPANFQCASIEICQR